MLHLAHFFTRGRGWLVLPLFFGVLCVVLLVVRLVVPSQRHANWPGSVGFLLAAPILWRVGSTLAITRGERVIDERRVANVWLPAEDTLCGVHVRDWCWLALACGLVTLLR